MGSSQQKLHVYLFLFFSISSFLGLKNKESLAFCTQVWFKYNLWDTLRTLQKNIKSILFFCSLISSQHWGYWLSFPDCLHLLADAPKLIVVLATSLTRDHPDCVQQNYFQIVPKPYWWMYVQSLLKTLETFHFWVWQTALHSYAQSTLNNDCKRQIYL